MKRTILVLMLACLTLGGCASIAEMRDPLPQAEGSKRQMNKGLWEWRNA